MELARFDLIVVNTSGGKDSQTMLGLVSDLATAQSFDRSRIVAVHADLGRVEWPGVAELAEAQAAHYGIRFEKASRPQGDLLAQIEARGMFPSSSARYCTSDQKRGQVAKVITALVAELELEGRPAQVLNCMGLRREESPARAKKAELQENRRLTGKGTRRVVTDWMPIIDWTEEEIWDDIARRGVPHHWAYGEGMPRLSCCFCVLASRSALVKAAELMPELAQTYLELEERIGHTIQAGTSMSEIIAEARTSSTPVVIGWAA